MARERDVCWMEVAYIIWATYIWLCGVVVVALVFGFERSGVRLSVVTVSEYNTFYVLNARFTVKLTTFEGVRITVPKTVTVEWGEVP